MEKKKVYNGVIDWWKFVFCIVIVIFYVGEKFGSGDYLLKYGKYAVEFFFVVSGYFMCAHAMRQPEEKGLKNIGVENFKFIFGKIKTIFPAYVFAYVSQFIIWILNDGRQILEAQGLRRFLPKLICTIPNFLLLDQYGVYNTEVMGVSWYVSAMLFVMFITYPLLRKWRKNYCLIASPLIALFLLGYYAMSSGGNGGKDVWFGFMKAGVVRAFININLGCLAYEVSDWIKSVFADLSIWKKVLIRIVEPLSYVCAIALMHFGNNNAIAVISLLMFVGVSITMSGNSALAKICDNGVCRFMGKLSLWIYFVHAPVRRFVVTTYLGISYNDAFVKIWVFTAAMVLIGMGGYELMKKIRDIKKRDASERF